MNPRLFEKLYGFRVLIVILLISILVVLGLVFFVNPILQPSGIKATAVIAASTQETSSSTLPQRITDTLIPSPTFTLTVIQSTSTPIFTSTTAPTAKPTLTITPTFSTTPSIASLTLVPTIYCRPKPRRIVDGYYVVRCGDTLERIALDFCGSDSYWLDIYNANRDKFVNQDQLLSGTKLTIPCLSH